MRVSVQNAEANVYMIQMFVFYTCQAHSILALPTNIRLGWKGLPSANTSILGILVNYGCNKF